MTFSVTANIVEMEVKDNNVIPEWMNQVEAAANQNITLQKLSTH